MLPESVQRPWERRGRWNTKRCGEFRLLVQE